jgi:hypothetical protein
MEEAIRMEMRMNQRWTVQRIEQIIHQRMNNSMD